MRADAGALRIVCVPDGTTLSATGCLGIGSAGQPHLTRAVIMAYADGPPSPPDQLKSEGKTSDKISVVQEALQIEKVQQITGRVRIDLTTQTIDELVTVNRQSTEMVVTRHDIGRMIRPGEDPPQVRLDGSTTIIPVLEEVIVTQTRIVLRAELHVTAKVTAQTDRQSFPLRKQTANVTRFNPDGMPVASEKPLKETDSHGHFLFRTPRSHCFF